MIRKLLPALTALATVATLSTAAQAGIVVGAQYEVADHNGSVFTPNVDNGLYAAVGFTLNAGTAQQRGVWAQAGMFSLDYRAHGTSAAWRNFLSFCLQPDVYLTPFQNPYTARAPGDAGYDLARISELWGTYFSGIDSDVKAAAFQVALWELSYGERDRNLSTGAFRLNDAGGAIGTLAQSWLNAIEANDGPSASNLVVLVDTRSSHGSDRQDLLTQNVPEPSTLALLGLGLFAAGLRRRRNGEQARGTTAPELG